MSNDLETRNVAQNTLTTFQSLLTTFSDFLVVSIHTILYERGIYPPNTFISTRKYNFPVRQNRHPRVCQWITDAVTAVEAEMLKGTVNRVAVVIYAPTAEVMERFMFDVSSFPEVQPEEALTLFEGDGNSTDREELNKVSIADIEEQLRATVRKLAYCGSKLGPLPKDSTYTIAVELKEKADPPIGVYPEAQSG
jgi:mitotic spindle assembly checkpoint protein MAD2B